MISAMDDGGMKMVDVFSKQYAKSSSILVSQNNATIAKILDQTYHWSRLPDDQYVHLENRHEFENMRDVLSPLEIQQFLSASQAFESEEKYHLVVGRVAGKLINNAHQNGFNSFRFDVTGLKPLHYFGCNVIEQEGQNLEVVVSGVLGSNAFLSASGTFYIEEAGSGTHTELKRIFTCKRLRSSPFFLSICSELSHEKIMYHQHTSGNKTRQINHEYIKLPTGEQYYKQHEIIDHNNCVELHASNFYTSKGWQEIWEPAVPYFEKLNQLFGVKP